MNLLQFVVVTLLQFAVVVVNQIGLVNLIQFGFGLWIIGLEADPV